MSELFEALRKTVKQFVEAQKAGINPLKEQFETVIKDTSIPLAQRWELFAMTPSEMNLKNSQSSIQHFQVLDEFNKKYYKGKYARDFNWFDEYGSDRHQEIYLVEFIDDFVMDYFYDLDSSEEERVYDGDCMMSEFVKDVKRIDALKEEILQRNLGSFILDW